MLRRFRDRRRPYSGVPEIFDDAYDIEGFDEDEHDAVESAISTPQHEDGDATKTMLDAIHLQVVPPSLVDNRGTARSRQQNARQRLDHISQRLRSESPSLWNKEPQWQEESLSQVREPSGRYNHKASVTVDTNTTRSNTASTPTGTTNSGTISTMRSGTVSALTKENPCHAPFLRNLGLCGAENCTLREAVCMNSNAILPNETLLDKVSSAEASYSDHFLDAENDDSFTKEEGSLMDDNGRNSSKDAVGCGAMHAYAYNPTPPSRRTKPSSSKEVPRATTPSNPAVVRGVQKANAEFITGAAVDGSVNRMTEVYGKDATSSNNDVDDLRGAATSAAGARSASWSKKKGPLVIISSHHGQMTSHLDESTVGFSQMNSSQTEPSGADVYKMEVVKPASPNRPAAVLTKRIHADTKIQTDLTKTRATSNLRTETTAASAQRSSSRNGIQSKTANLIRAITPIRALSPNHRVNSAPSPPGRTSVKPSIDPTAIDSTATRAHNVAIEKQYPMLEKKNNPQKSQSTPPDPEPKTNFIRRLTPKRSPSPRRPSPPATSPKTSDSSPKTFIRRAGRALTPKKSPPQQRPGETKKRSPSAQRSPSPAPTTKQAGNSHLRNRFFKNRTKKDTNSERGQDPDVEKDTTYKRDPPDPPASASWKVGGSPKLGLQKGSPRGLRKNREGKAEGRQQSQIKPPQKPQPQQKEEDGNQHTQPEPSPQSEQSIPGNLDGKHQAHHGSLRPNSHREVPEEPQLHHKNQKQSQTKRPMSQQRGISHMEKQQQRRNYHYVMIQQQKLKQLEKAQQEKSLSQHKPQNTHKSEPVISSREQKSQRQHEQQQFNRHSEKTPVQYLMSDPKNPQPIKSKQQKEQPQQHPLQQPKNSPPSSRDTVDLKAPVQLKKVLSSPSIMISTLTSQTMNTTNTTTTSKFWDGIEGYQPTSQPTSPISPTGRNVSFESGLHGNPKKFDNIAEEDFVILKKLNEKNQELQEFFKGYRLDGNGQEPKFPNRAPPRTRVTDQLAKEPASPTGSGISNAFSLNLPMNKHGYFDDSDISALAMGDSATVYHMRASAAAKKNVSDYWKEKYERLKEETRRANQARGMMNGALLEEDEDSFLRLDKAKQSPRASALEGVQKAPKRKNANANVEPESDDDRSHLLQQQQLLLRCGYRGGKKAKDSAQKTPNDNDQRSKSQAINNSLSCSQPVQVLLSRAQCFMPEEEVSIEVTSPDRSDHKQCNTRKRSGPDVEDIANRIQCSTLLIDGAVLPDASSKGAKDKKCHRDTQDRGRRNPNRHTPTRSVDFSPDVHVMSDTFSQADEMDADFVLTEVEASFSLESLNSDHMPLRHVGYVQRMQTPSPHPKGENLNSANAIDGLACYGDPMYVMDDELALKEWNRKRSSKALADELSAVNSRGFATDGSELSELSENAKLIFEAALKHDMKTLREQRSRSASRNSSRRSSPVVTPVRPVTPEKSSVSSLASGASAMSSHFASNIPPDFANWFELPSPGSSCITLIPMLKGHLKNAVLVEFLSNFDGTSNKIDANGVHRITPRHRVHDVLQKSYNEYLDSPLIASKSSMDSEYMGPIIADGDDGSIRFANASLHLGGISDACINHIKKREYQDAIDIYTALLRSCQATSESKLGVVGQLIASTLHNICVLHLWKEEFDLALPYSRECLRIKSEHLCEDVLMVHSWANMGLIHYVLEAHTSAIVAFRNASELENKTSLSGRLQNNLGCVNAEIGNLEGAVSALEQSLQWQKESASSSNDAATSDAENLISISMTIFNIGVVCARQKHYQVAIKHTEASHAMQEALLGAKSELAGNTLFYLEMLKKVMSTSNNPKATMREKILNENLEVPEAITSKKQEVPNILDIIPNSPERRMSAQDGHDAKHATLFSTKSNQVSYPMLSLGSLKVEATIIERVRECLDRYDSSVMTGKDHLSIGRNLLCKMPHVTKQTGIRSKLMSFGMKTLRKREMQAELQDNLERYGTRHPLVGHAHNNLGIVLLCMENFEESIHHFDKSIHINTNALGSKHPDIASSLMFMALAQFALERFDDAMTSMIRARRINEKESGSQTPDLYQILNNLACVHFERGDLKRAESLLQEALDLQRETFRTESEFLKGVSTVLCNIAFVHAKNGAFPKALIELEGALQIRQDILFEETSIGDITENMAYILAIHQLQHGSGNIDDITKEYITMLQKT